MVAEVGKRRRYIHKEGTEWPRARWLDGAQLGQQGTEMSRERSERLTWK